MNKRNLELLGLEDGANAEQINAAYETLRARYAEERFLDGEAGNEAARMLTKIGVARDELLAELSELEKGGEGDGSAFNRVEDAIKANDLTEAQRILDSFNERGAQWHYYQSVVFYRKNWMNESKKQLEIAIQLEPDNDKYKETYKKLNDKINYDSKNNAGGTVYQGQTMTSDADEQMGGNWCSSCLQCCYLNMCLNCLCNGCCR